MSAVGGFFELEIAKHGAPPHQAAATLTSGRACLREIVRRLRPRRMLVPFYACDAVIEPLTAEAIAVDYYGLTPSLEPSVPTELLPEQCLLYINYFGLKNDTAARLASTFGARAIIDDTHAFFADGYPTSWSFNSARKFFGVPDGAYLFGPDPVTEMFEPNRDVLFAHLVNRLLGNAAEAFAQYQEAERQVTTEPRGMSVVSERLLHSIDYDSVARTRRRNYAMLHARFGDRNLLSEIATLGDDAVPFCYPLLVDRDVAHEELWKQSLFVPKLWPEVMARDGEGFAADRIFAARILPLPIDHRYDGRDMDRLAEGVARVLAE
jgi:hypothetical protein